MSQSGELDAAMFKIEAAITSSRTRLSVLASHGCGSTREYESELMTLKFFEGMRHDVKMDFAAKMDEDRRRAAIHASQQEIIAKTQAEFKMQMDMQKIRMGDESRAVAADLGAYRQRFEEESEKCKQRIARIQAAAKPKCNHNDCMRDALSGTSGLCPDHYQQYAEACDRQDDMTSYGQEEKRYSQMLQEPDDYNPWHSHPCAEEGCKMDGHEGYGYLCRDHYYERKHDKPDLFIVIPDALVFTVGTMLSLMGLAGVLEGEIGLVLIAGLLYSIGIWFCWAELGLSRDWKYKRADKPRIPTKGAAKPQPFTLPDVEQP